MIKIITGFIILITVHKCIKVTKTLIQFNYSSGLIQCAMQRCNFW